MKEIKSVIIFGGNGFIGSHVVDNLLAHGIEVTVFARLNPNKQGVMLIPPQVKFFYGDIKDREAVLKAVSLHDGAINLAGILGTSETIDNPFPSAMVNIIGALNFFEAVRAHDRKAVQITVGNHFMNNSYAITKTTSERFALMYNKEHGTKIAVVRGLNAYGPGQKAQPVRKIIPNFIIPALRKEPISVYGDGSQVMDMIYVEDLAEIIVRALLYDHGVYDKVFSAGTGERTTVKEIAQEVIRQTESPAGVKFLPMRQGEPEHAVVVGDPETLLPLQYEPRLFNSLEDGLSKTIEWYKNSYDILNY